MEYEPSSRQELYVDTVAMRSFISKLVAIAQVTKEIPNFLHGANDEGVGIELTRRDLGDYEPFYLEYQEIIRSRFEEARQFDRYLWMTARRLAWGLSKVLDEDVEVSAYFTDDKHDLAEVVKRNGLNVQDDPRLAVRGFHDSPPPSEGEDRVRQRNRPEY